LGTVAACDEEAAFRAAIKLLAIADAEQQKRLLIRRA